jgi:hypothetical protein
MKIYYSVAIIAFSLLGCTNRYALQDTGKEKSYLSDKINAEVKNGKLSNKPLVVLDGVPYRYDIELKNNKLNIYKADIVDIEILEKETGVKIYGEPGTNGVLLLTTRKINQTSLNESVVLIILDNKEISKTEMNAINPENIESIDVIKNKESIKKYTTKPVDGVIVIHTKQKI